jgi:hypothetical protein
LQIIISITSFFPACFVLTLIGNFSCCSAAYSQQLEFPFAHQIGPNIVGGNLPFATKG